MWVYCLFSGEFLREFSSERCLCTTRRPFSIVAITSSRRTWPPAQSTLSGQTRAEKKPELWLIPKLHIVEKRKKVTRIVVAKWSIKILKKNMTWKGDCFSRWTSPITFFNWPFQRPQHVAIILCHSVEFSLKLAISS